MKRKSTTTRKSTTVKNIKKKVTSSRKSKGSKKSWLLTGRQWLFAATGVIVFVVFGLLINLDKGGSNLHAAVAVTAIEAESMTWNPAGTVVNDTTASGVKAVKQTAAATGKSTVQLSGDATELRIVAKGDQCNAAPALEIKLDGKVVATQEVSDTNWKQYTLPVAATAGSHNLEVRFTNPFTSWWLWMKLCDRTVTVDKVEFFQPLVDPTPSPTPTTSPSTSPTPTPTTTPPVGSIPAGSEYVALGDSYSSGWGADRTPANLTPNKSVYDKYGYNCGRSDKAAQVLLTLDLNLSLINAACGGTNTTHLLTTSYQNEPPQLNRLSANTKLVTMTIGGNDTAIIWMLQFCVMSGDCWRNGNWIVESYANQWDTKINALEASMKNVLRTAAQKSPNAKIRPAGYPYIIAGPGEPAGTCASWLKPQEQVFFADGIVRTNNAIKRAAEAIATETGKDIKYVDPLAVNSPFMQRNNGQMLDGCSTNINRYMNGTNDGDLAGGGWHPNIYGQRMYYELYRASL